MNKSINDGKSNNVINTETLIETKSAAALRYSLSKRRRNYRLNNQQEKHIFERKNFRETIVKDEFQPTKDKNQRFFSERVP